ncbi:hypothetical protein ACSQ67_014172 [Phaseolus vulgaris]
MMISQSIDGATPSSGTYKQNKTFGELRTNQRKRWKREKWRWKRTSYSMAFKNTFEMLSEDAHQPPSSSAFTSSPTPHLVTISGSNATSAHFS